MTVTQKWIVTGTSMATRPVSEEDRPDVVKRREAFGPPAWPQEDDPTRTVVQIVPLDDFRTKDRFSAFRGANGQAMIMIPTEIAGSYLPGRVVELTLRPLDEKP